MEKTREQRPGQSKAWIVEQINQCLHSGEYSRAVDVLRGAAAEFPDDADLSGLENLAQDGLKRKAEADGLITQSQELFAQQKPAEAIQSLREAYGLDTSNSLARAILANALVEHAQSLVETDWWEAGKLSKQALELNPAHPTAKTIRSQIRDRKEASTVDDWISQVQRLQSSADLSAALSLLAEGLDVHARDPKLLLLQDAIQRDYNALRRQARRGDLQELRRMKNEIDRAADAPVKQELAERIQALAAKYWTDGEVLALANGLLQRLRLGGSPVASRHNVGAPIIFHVPRPSSPKPSPSSANRISPGKVESTPVATSQVAPSSIPPTVTQSPRSGENIAPAAMMAADVRSAIVPQKTAFPFLPTSVPEKAAGVPPRLDLPDNVPTSPPEPKAATPAADSLTAAELPAPAAIAMAPPQPERPTKSSATIVVLASAAAVILVAATFFLTRSHYASTAAKTSDAAPSISAPASTVPPESAPDDSAPAPSAPEVLPTSEPSGTAVELVPEDRPPAESSRASGRNPNPPQPQISARKSEEAKPIPSPQPQASLPQAQPSQASLAIQGGPPGATVLIDLASAGTIQPDGTLAISTVSPGDHTVELRKERFRPRQLKEHFVAGATVSLAAADTALEAVPAELKITFSPADANVAIVKGDLLKVVSSGVPLTLAPGTYTLTARTAERFTRSATLEIVAGQSKTVDLSLAPSGMSKWDDPGSWKQEKDYFTRKGGDFVLYGAAPASGTFSLAAMPAKGHLLQWVLNYTDSKNYVLFQMDDDYFYRAVVRNGQKADEIRVPDKGDKKSFRTLHIRVSPTEIVHQIKHGDSWTVLDRWTQPGTNLGGGKFGFYVPGNDQVALSAFSHYADLNLR